MYRSPSGTSASSSCRIRSVSSRASSSDTVCPSCPVKAGETVRERFKVRSETEKDARRALIQLESEILKRIGELQH